MTDKKQILTANELRSGQNVYFVLDNDEGRWDADIHQATAFSAEEIEAATEKANAFETNNTVVGIYAIPVGDNQAPVSAREKIRAAGPSTQYGHTVN